MAGTPFTTATVPFAGRNPAEGSLTRQYGSRRLWLGQPGNMVELPARVSDYRADPSRGEVAHGLYGGAQAVTMFADAARSWQLSWPRLSGRDWQVVNGFYRRLFGAGPWAWLPPEDVNRLTLRQSMCGAVASAVEGWVTTGGTVTYQAAQASRISPCGVMLWSPVTTGKFLAPATLVGATLTPDTDRAVPFVPGEAVVMSCWMKAGGAGGSVQPALRGVAADGTVNQTVTGVTTAVPAGVWTQVSLLVPAGTLTAGTYLLPVWQSMNTNAVFVTTPVLCYAPQLVEWEAGGGVPRVVWPSAPGRAMRGALNPAASMTLVESILGAA